MELPPRAASPASGSGGVIGTCSSAPASKTLDRQLGSFQAAATDLTTRGTELGKARAYYKDFLGRLRDYGFAEDLLGRGDADPDQVCGWSIAECSRGGGRSLCG